MKKILLPAVFFLLCIPGWAQGNGVGRIGVLSFPDSVATVLQNTRSEDAATVAATFSQAWSLIGADLQRVIQRQTYMMRRKRFSLRPGLVNYFGAIANAVSVERADAATLTKYLSVCGRVIENETPANALKFFAASRLFFSDHALHSERTYRLYARNANYTFEYIEPTPLLSWDTPLEEDTSASDLTENDTWTDQPEDLSDTPLYEESAPENSGVDDVIPSWLTPETPPYVEGPVINFSKVDLNFVTSYDSVFLKETKGTFSLSRDLFVGEGGSFDWAAAGLDPDSVYCNFISYFFDTRKPELKSSLVKLIYQGKTPGFVAGNFEFKSQSRPDSVFSTYPRFHSYAGNLEITGLADANVTYIGGFTLIGNTIASTSVSGEPATIEVTRDGQRKFSARSAEFIFGESTISSNKARIKLYQDNDSLVHAQVRMKYTFVGDSIQQLLLQKDKGEMRNAPYSSSFFNVDFSADIVRWNLSADSLDIQTDGGRSIVPMIIESTDFYDLEDYRLLKGVGFRFHPLNLMVGYALKMGVSEFYSGDVAIYAGLDAREVKAAAEFLAQKGFAIYTERTDRIQLKDKAFTLFQAAKGESDYDNLKIHSVASKAANATVNLEKGQMTVRGVDEFKVSDSLNVRIKPDSSIITILQNRDIKFNGTVNAGNFEISGKGFTLKYDSFFINLMHIDSINFYVTEKNARGQQIRRKVSNSMVGADSIAAAAGGLGDISKSSGTLYISRADNKSGKKKIPNYPRLDATTGGVIYFDREEVLGGVYDRSMFFVVPPFKLDSLNDADPTSINFDGTFVSSGMFPNFKEKLTTQPDKSLGFQHAIPSTGYQLYKVDSKMNGVLSMDNRGLRGLGEIDFLAATVYSQDFIFYPDSVITRGTRAIIQEKQFGAVKFPQASLPDYDMKWYPKQDRMLLKNLKAPFNFYDSTAHMQGILTISKEGVAGSGKLETRGTEVVSRYLHFNADDFGARHARFKLKSDDPNKNLLSGNDVRLRFNLVDNSADISPEIEGTAAIDFPYAQFKTSIPKAHWDLAQQKITMSKAPDVPLESSYFYSTRKELDSLSFLAQKAEYDLRSQQLKVSGIPYITVADALITPENNEVLILENARIGTLKNTTIVLDTLNAFHRLTEGVVDIISRKEFSGYATYQYVNFLNDTFAIKMTDFHLEPIAGAGEGRRSKTGSLATQQTVATGSVTEKESLVLGAGMYYKGDMTMYATRPALQLTGYVKLDIRKIKDYNTWIRYTQTGDETEVLINFDDAITEDGKKATAGLHFGALDNDLYVTFLNDKRSEDDDDFFIPSGTLFYDKEVNEYKIEDREKAAGNKLSGKVFSYNDETRAVRFEGPVNLLQGLKNFNVTATSIGTGNLETNEISMNSLLVVDTDVPPTALEIMARSLLDVIKNESIAEGLGDQTELLYKIADIVGERLAKDYETKSLQGYVSLATMPPLARPLVISDVNLKWSPAKKAFFSEGLIGVSNIMKTDVNGGFEGFLEVKKDEGGLSIFNLFIKASPEVWFYFGFEGNRMLVYSSNTDFNTVLSKKTNAGKARIGEVAFVPGSDDETLAFINRFRKDYYGIEVPYDLYNGSQATQKKADEKKNTEDDGF